MVLLHGGILEQTPWRYGAAMIAMTPQIEISAASNATATTPAIA